MKVIDRLLGFSLQERYGDSPYYQAGKTALKCMAVGGVTTIGGMVAGETGMRQGYEIAIEVGLPVYTIGSLILGGCACLDFLEYCGDDSGPTGQ